MIIARKREAAAVLLSLEDYESLTATADLLRNPRNARRRLDAVAELKEGRGKQRRLVE